MTSYNRVVMNERTKEAPMKNPKAYSKPVVWCDEKDRYGDYYAHAMIELPEGHKIVGGWGKTRVEAYRNLANSLFGYQQMRRRLVAAA